jgi:hypothetical protein
MKAITRRLGRLEVRLGLQPETEFDRRLRARIEAGQQRLAEARKCDALQPTKTGPHTEAYCWRLMQAMSLGG